MVEQRQRIDKWLWHARFAKTRSLAQKLVTGGKVRIDREKVTSPSKAVKIGNVLTLALPNVVRIIKIIELDERRGSFEIARTLYEDLAPPPDKKAKKTDSNSASDSMDAGKRPDKRQRRERLKLKRNATN